VKGLKVLALMEMKATTTPITHLVMTHKVKCAKV